jgi:hypothetical protein
MSRISSIVLVELPPNTVSIRCSLVPGVPHVLDMIEDSFVCFLNVCGYLVHVLVFGLSALKPLWHVKPE